MDLEAVDDAAASLLPGRHDHRRLLDELGVGEDEIGAEPAEDRRGFVLATRDDNDPGALRNLDRGLGSEERDLGGGVELPETLDERRGPLRRSIGDEDLGDAGESQFQGRCPAGRAGPGNHHPGGREIGMGPERLDDPPAIGHVAKQPPGLMLDKTRRPGKPGGGRGMGQQPDLPLTHHPLLHRCFLESPREEAAPKAHRIDATEGLCEALREDGRLDGAEQATRDAIRLSGGSRGDTWATLALILDSTGRVEDAKKSLAKALEVEPKLHDPDARVQVMAMERKAADELKRLMEKVGLTPGATTRP